MGQLSILIYILSLLVITGIIAFVLWHLFRRRLTELQSKNDSLTSELRESAASRAAAEAVAKRIPELEGQVERIQFEKGELMKENAALKNQQKADAEKIEFNEHFKKNLMMEFESLSSKILKSNSETYLSQAKEQFENILRIVRGDWGTHKEELKNMVEPLEKTLKNLDQYTKEIETKREGAYSGIQEQLRALSDAQGMLQTTAAKLTQAMRAPNVRGNWGQEQLRRIVEMVGMLDHVDFGEQVAIEEGRPDMIVNLPNKGILPVDAKTPMTSYLDALDSEDESFRQSKFQELAATMRTTIRNLGNRGYWKKLERTPEVVIMFIPSDGCIAAAFEQDVGLFEFAVSNNVIITSPFTLYALLKAVAYGWQQHQVTENALKIAEESRVFFDRLSIFMGHLKKSGKNLSSAVESYNESVRSFNSRLRPSGERLIELGASAKDLETLDSIDVTPQITEGDIEP